MPATLATTVAQRREMMLLAEEGYPYTAIAEQVEVSFWTVRKWVRQAKRGGLETRKGEKLPELDPVHRDAKT